MSSKIFGSCILGVSIACLHCMQTLQNSSDCTLLARLLIFGPLTNQEQICCTERPEILSLLLYKAPTIIKASDWCLTCDRLMTRAPWDRLHHRLQRWMSQLYLRYPTSTPPPVLCTYCINHHACYMASLHQSILQLQRLTVQCHVTDLLLVC